MHPIVIIFVMILLCVFQFLFFQNKIGATGYCHPDEPFWISVSHRYFKKSFVERDFSPDFWQLSMNTFGSNTPHLAKYYIGAFIYFSGYHDNLYPEQIRKEVLSGKSDLLQKSRVASLIAGIACSSMVFLVFYYCFNFPVALLSWFLLVLHPIFFRFCQLCMLDIFALTTSMGFVFLSCFYVMSLAGNKSRLSQMLISFLLMFMMVSAIASKLSALIYAPAFFLFLCFFLLRYIRQNNLKTFMHIVSDRVFMNICRTLLLICILAPFLFIALNPFMYSKPFSRYHEFYPTKFHYLLNMNNIVRGLQEKFPDEALYTPLERMQGVMGNLMGSHGTCGQFFSNLLCRYADIFFMLAGVFYYLYWIRKCRHMRFFQLGLILYAYYFILIMLTLSVWTPLNWERFFMPGLIYVTGFEALGIYGGAKLLSTAIYAINKKGHPLNECPDTI